MVVTDGASNTINLSAIVSEPSAIVVSDNSTPAGCGTCADGTASLSVSGGTPPYTIVWTASASEEDTISDLLPGYYTYSVSDSNGCSIFDSVQVSISEGLASFEISKSFITSPNPADKYILISGNDIANSEIVVLDLLGRIIMKYSLLSNQNSFPVDISQIPNAIYIISVRYKNGININKKMIKE